MKRAILIKLNQIGIQLDKEHHADQAELSMMTQVISACAALGHSLKESTNMYKALSALTEIGIRPYVNAIAECLGTNSETGKEHLKKALVDTILDAMSTGTKSKDGLVFEMVNGLLTKQKAGQKLSDDDYKQVKLALSNNAVMNKVSSLLAVALTNVGIKFKFSGVLSVLCPSYDIMKLYGNKLYRQFNSTAELEREQEAYREKGPVSISRVKIGHSYVIENTATGEVENIQEVMNQTVCGQSWAMKASVIFFYSMVAYRAEWRYGIYAHRVALIDLGHIGENLYLASTSLGLGTCGIGAFEQDICDPLFMLDGKEEFTVYSQPVGTIEQDDQAEKAFYAFVEKEGL